MPLDAESTTPANAAGDNQYVLEVSATSGSGERQKTTPQTVVVTVTNEIEPPAAPDMPDVTTVSTTRLMVTWTEPVNTGPPIEDYDYRYRQRMPPQSAPEAALDRRLAALTELPEDDWQEVMDTSITMLEVMLSGLLEDTEYEVQVRAKNAEGAGEWSPAQHGRTDTAAPTPPVFTGAAAFSVEENQDAVGTVETSTSTSYALSGGVDGALFEIDGASGALRFLRAPDYESPRDVLSTDPANDAGDNQYVLVVRATGGTGDQAQSAWLTVVVEVTDVDEPPAAPSRPAVRGTSISAVRVTWAEPANRGPPIEDYDYRYRRYAPQGSWTEVTGTTLTERRVTLGGLAEGTRYEVQVRATNPEGTGEWSESGTGSTHVNLPPTFTAESAAFSVAENETAVGTVQAVDANEEDSVTGYALTGGVDRELFELDAATGALSFKAAPNYENPLDAPSSSPRNPAANNEYLLLVSATSGTGERHKSAAQTVVVTVTDVDEPPGKPAPPAVAGTSVSRLRVTWTPPATTGPPIEDYDYRYRTHDPRGAWVEVTGSDLTEPEVTVAGLNEGTRYDVQVRASNAEGIGPWSDSGTGATHRNVAPEFTAESAAFSVAENETAVGTVQASDADERDSVTGYALAGGVDRELFELDAVSGEIAFRVPPNYEAPLDAASTAPVSAEGDNRYLLLVRATSGTGEREKSVTQWVVVTVTDVDEPPAAPPAPTVTPLSSTSLHVAWTAPENTGPPIDDYDYRYRTHAPRSPWVELTDTVSTALEVTLEGLRDGTKYDVQVRARNAEGSGPWSPTRTARTVPLGSVEAWLTRFVRTAAGHVLEAVEARFRGVAGDRSEAAIAGRQVTAAGERELSAHDPTALDAAWAVPHPMEFRELLAGSSFNLATAAAAGAAEGATAGRWALWARSDWSRFAGVEGNLTLDGSVTTGTVGADYAHARLLAGLALAYSSADGSFRDAGGAGDLEATLLSAHPYVRLALLERLTLWGLLGFGLLGEVALDAPDTARTRTDFRLLMGAFGGAGTLLPATRAGGFELTAKADALLAHLQSDARRGLLVGTEADLVRLRLLLEAAYRGLPLLGGTLSPALEVGVRYDDGNAERGAGLVLAGSLDYALPAWGLALTVSGGGLLLHQADGFGEWGAGGNVLFDPGSPGRGVALRVAPSWGRTTTRAHGLWALADASSLAPGAPRRPNPGARVDAELSYGFAVVGERATVTPYLGLAYAPEATDTSTWRLGGRVAVAPGLSLSVEGVRRTGAATAPEDSLALRAGLRY